MDANTLIILFLGVLGTWLGAEFLVRGSSRLAMAFGVRPLVVGLTVVAFGTSSPEAVVSFVAATKGASGIALGNVLGSNIANVGLILGAVALLHPLRVKWTEVRIDVAFMVGVSVLAAALAYLDLLARPAGIGLLTLLVVSMIWWVRGGHRPPMVETTEEPVASVHRGWAVLQALLGLAILVVGANLLVTAAENIARAFGIPDELIGATMVAVGTSLPELAASIVAVVRGEHEIGIGNIVGSNVMNLLFVLGGVCVIQPVGIAPQITRLVLPVMLGFAVLLVPMLATGGRVGRREGGLLLAAYFAFALKAYF